MIGVHRRVVGLVAFVALLLVVAIVVAWALASPDNGSSTGDSVGSDEVAAPWWDSTGLHFEGEVYEEFAGTSYAATQQSALVEVMSEDDYIEIGSADEARLLYLESVVELPIIGKEKELTHRLLGDIIADVQGSLATWVEPALRGEGVKLVAYDTATHQVLRTLSVADGSARPFAVDGQRIYVAGEELPLRVWDVERSASRLAPVPHLPEGSFVADAHDGKLIVFGDEQTQLIAPDGDVIKSFDGVMFLTFSPDGSHVAGLTWDGGTDMDAFVWDVADAAEVPLRLPKNAEILDVQWEADGDLLIPTVAIDKGGDRLEGVSAVYNTCSTATGECQQVEGTKRIDPSEVGSSSGQSQLGQVVGS